MAIISGDGPQVSGAGSLNSPCSSTFNGNTQTVPTTALPATDSDTPDLLRLPPELRNRIYELALCGFVDVRAQRWYIERRQTKPPGVLLACKQTYYEAHKIYYRLTTFEFKYSKSIYSWLANIGSEKAALISNIHQWDLWAAGKATFDDNSHRIFDYVGGRALKLELYQLRHGLAEVGVRIGDGVVKVKVKGTPFNHRGPEQPPAEFKAIEDLRDNEYLEL